IVVAFALAQVARADPDRVEPVEHIQLGQGDGANPVECYRVASDAGIEPAHPARPPGGGPVLTTHLPDLLAERVGELGWQWAVSHPRRIRLEDPHRQVDPGRSYPRTGQGSACARRRGGDIRVGPEIEIEHAALGSLDQDSLFALHRPLNDREYVDDEALETFPIWGVLRQDGVPVERINGVEALQDRVLDLAEDKGQLFLQEARLQKVAGAKADAANLVGVSGSDPPPGGSQTIISALLLLELVADRMPGHAQLGAVGG